MLVILSLFWLLLYGYILANSVELIYVLRICKYPLQLGFCYLFSTMAIAVWWVYNPCLCFSCICDARWVFMKTYEPLRLLYMRSMLWGTIFHCHMCLCLLYARYTPLINALYMPICLLYALFVVRHHKAHRYMSRICFVNALCMPCRDLLGSQAPYSY